MANVDGSGALPKSATCEDPASRGGKVSGNGTRTILSMEHPIPPRKSSERMVRRLFGGGCPLTAGLGDGRVPQGETPAQLSWNGLRGPNDKRPQPGEET